jgi:hypothetical protein
VGRSRFPELLDPPPAESEYVGPGDLQIDLGDAVGPWIGDWLSAFNLQIEMQLAFTGRRDFDLELRILRVFVGVVIKVVQSVGRVIAPLM